MHFYRHGKASYAPVAQRAPTGYDLGGYLERVLQSRGYEGWLPSLTEEHAESTDATTFLEHARSLFGGFDARLFRHAGADLGSLTTAALVERLRAVPQVTTALAEELRSRKDGLDILAELPGEPDARAHQGPRRPGEDARRDARARAAGAPRLSVVEKIEGEPIAKIEGTHGVSPSTVPTPTCLDRSRGPRAP